MIILTNKWCLVDENENCYICEIVNYNNMKMITLYHDGDEDFEKKCVQQCCVCVYVNLTKENSD